MIAAIVVVCMFGAFLFMRYMLNQSKIKMMEQANARHEKIKSLDTEAKATELTKKCKDDVKGDSDYSAQNIVDDSQDHIEEYKEQYNAAHDFAIFKVDEGGVGGLMNLQQKQN